MDDYHETEDPVTPKQVMSRISSARDRAHDDSISYINDRLLAWYMDGRLEIYEEELPTKGVLVNFATLCALFKTGTWNVSTSPRLDSADFGNRIVRHSIIFLPPVGFDPLVPYEE